MSFRIPLLLRVPLGRKLAQEHNLRFPTSSSRLRGEIIFSIKIGTRHNKTMHIQTVLVLVPNQIFPTSVKCQIFHLTKNDWCFLFFMRLAEAFSYRWINSFNIYLLYSISSCRNEMEYIIKVVNLSQNTAQIKNSQTPICACW